jgi:hypothetical protein
MDALGMWPPVRLYQPGSAQGWELRFSSVLVDRHDRDTGLTACSADALLVRNGATSGYRLGRLSYTVQPKVDGGIDYELPDIANQAFALGVALQAAQEMGGSVGVVREPAPEPAAAPAAVAAEPQPAGAASVAAEHDGVDAPDARP